MVRPKTCLLLLAILVSLIPLSVSIVGYAGDGFSPSTLHAKAVAKTGGLVLYELNAPVERELEKILPAIPFSVKPATLYAYIPDPSFWEKLDHLHLQWRITSSTRNYGYAAGKLLIWLPPGKEYLLQSLAQDGNSASSGEGENRAIIVIGSEKLRGFAVRLARIHQTLGVETTIVSIKDIAEMYPEAEQPPYTLSQEEVEKYATGYYNMSIALKLVSFLREVVENGTARYIVLMGDASQIPPFYYRSSVLSSLLSPVQGMVPTDYWYMDPDYDWNIELVVGRIPFTDIVSLDKYIDTLEKWVKGGDWEATGLIAGGALFAWPLMMGETFASDVSAALAGKLELSYLLLTTGNYSSLDFTASIGRYGYYFIASHGVGNAYVDYRPGGVWGYRFEELLKTDTIPYPARPGAYASPACLTAWWDTSVVEPGFTPPSLGVALLSRGAAVSYVGSSRIAIEFLVDVKAEGNGDYSVGYYGAMRLVQLYANMLLSSKTLGEAYAKALEAYISLPYTSLEALTPVGAEKLGYLTLFEFTFLGDPVTPNKAYKAPTRERRPANMEAPGYTPFPLKALLVSFASVAQGELPLLVVEPGENITITFNHCPSHAQVVAVYRYSGILVDIKTVDITLLGGENTTCTGIIAPPSNPPGLYIVEYWYNTTLERRLLAVAGIKATATTRGIEVKIWGADLLRVVGDEPVYILVNGEPKAIIPGGRSSTSVRLDLPPGSYTLSLSPFTDYSTAAGGLEVAAAKEKLYELLTKTITVEPNTRRTGDLVVKSSLVGRKAYIMVMLMGDPVDANITAKTINGTTITPQHLSKGLYLLALPDQPVIVEARYENKTITAKGTTIIAPSPQGEPGTRNTATTTTSPSPFTATSTQPLTSTGNTATQPPTITATQEQGREKTGPEIGVVEILALTALAVSLIALFFSHTKRSPGKNP